MLSETPSNKMTIKLVIFVFAITWCPSVRRKLSLLIFSSETTGPIATKLWWNGPWMAPFQICFRDLDFQPR